MYGTIEQPLVKEVNKENNEIRWHEVETPAGTELYLKTTIQYVGDIGAKSEDINLEVVLPQGMVPAQEPEVVIGGFQYTGEDTGSRSGSVEAEPTISTNEAGKTVMTAKVGSMYTGTEIEISFKVKLEDIAATGQYKLWDVTATTKDKNSTAKDALRFWEAVTTEGTEYPITIESTGTGQAWTDVNRAASGTPITVYTQGGAVESITATDSNGNKIDISETEKMRIAAAMQETNQYTFQMPSAAVTVKVVFAQSQQPQAPGETPETGGMNGAQTEDMEGTGGMDSPRTGDTNSMVAVIAVAVILVLLFERGIGKSYRKAYKIVEDVANGHTDKRIPAKGSYELRQFAKDFNNIMDRAGMLDESRQEFVSNVSHELKTPITSIKVLADSLNMQDDVPIELYKEFMQDITNEIDRESKIIEDLLSLVKMDKSAAVMNISSVNVNEMLEIVLKRLKPIAQKKNVELLFESFRPVVAEIDEVKFTLVISNLVENAIKYNVSDGWVHVSLNADYQYFYVRVEDSGIGIPKESQDLVFDRFYRVDKARSRQTGGTGLGLAIVQNIVLLHHGTIKLHSEEGTGTTFTVRIPLNYVG